MRKLADRGGYRGVIEFLDVFDFHGGSSDVPVWSAGGEAVFYTAMVDGNVELFPIAIDGHDQRAGMHRPLALRHKPGENLTHRYIKGAF